MVKLGELRPVSDWVFKAAQGGSQDAIDHVCGLGEDRLALADLRDRGKAQCTELRGKFPAK